MKNDKEILEEFKERLDITRSGLSAQWQKTKEDWSFYHGDRDIYEKLGIIAEGESMPYMNMIQAQINAVLGYIIKLRREFKYMARVEGIEEQNYLTESCNNFARYIKENGNFNHIETEQDLALLVTGIGITDTEDNYNRANLNGEVVMHHIHSNCVGWDCEAKEKNLLDAKYVYTEYQYPIKEAMKLFPKVDEEDFEGANYEVANNGDYLIYNHETGYYTDTAYRKQDIQDDKVKVYKYQWLEFVKYYKVENPLLKVNEAQQSEAIQLLERELQIFKSIAEQKKEGKDDSDDLIAEINQLNLADKYYHIENKELFKFFKIFYGNIGVEFKYINANKRQYCTAQITGEKVIKKFKSPAQDGFSVKFKTGMFNHQAKVWTGLVEPLKDPQHLTNKTIAQMIVAMNNTSTGTVIVEADATNDIQQFEESYNSNNGVVRVNPGSLSQGKIQPKVDNGAVPAGYQSLYGLSQQLLMQVSGINPEFLGQSQNKQVSGILEQQRIEQVTNNFAYIFDAINLYQIEQARLLLSLMKAISKTSTTRLVKVMGEDGALLFKNIDNSVFDTEYEVVVEEAPEGAAQKHKKVEVMMQFAREVAPLGINAYQQVIPHLPLEENNKKELMQLFAPKEQEVDPAMQQMQQAQMQMQMEQMQAQLNKIKAETAHKNAQTTETLMKAEKLNTETEVVERAGIENVALENINVNL